MFVSGRPSFPFLDRHFCTKRFHFLIGFPRVVVSSRTPQSPCLHHRLKDKPFNSSRQTHGSFLSLSSQFFNPLSERFFSECIVPPQAPDRSVLLDSTPIDVDVNQAIPFCQVMKAPGFVFSKDDFFSAPEVINPWLELRR